jgi:hypothetical protein
MFAGVTPVGSAVSASTAFINVETMPVIPSPNTLMHIKSYNHAHYLFYHTRLASVFSLASIFEEERYLNGEEF